MLKLGMPTLIEAGTLENCVSVCRELRLDFIEINMNLPQYQLDRINKSHFKAIAEEYGLFYTFHLDENMNISDFNPYIADAYRRTALETIALAKELGAPVINMHLANGVHFTLPDRKVYLFSEYKQVYLQSILEFRTVCEKAIGNAGVMLCVENCDGFTDYQKEALRILLASPVFGLTFDIGHDHSSGGTDEPYIIKNKASLRHMHVHDAMGKKNHLPLGDGEIEIEKYLSLAEEQNCRVVLETKTIEGLKRSVNRMQGRAFAI